MTKILIVILVLFNNYTFASKKEIQSIINQINSMDSNSDNSYFNNRIILYGPSGNGKTSCAKNISEETNSVLITIDCSTIVNHMQNSGAQNISKVFEIAAEQIQQDNKKAIILIDGVDCLAYPKPDIELTIESLCFNLDKIEHDINYFVIITAINLNSISTNLINRFGDNIIELKNPDEFQRRAIIESLKEKLNLSLDLSLINYIVKQTNGFNIRSIDKIISSLKLYSVSDNRNLKNKFDELIKLYEQLNKMRNNSNNFCLAKLNLRLQNINLLLSLFPNLVANAIILYKFYNWFNNVDNQKVNNTILNKTWK